MADTTVKKLAEDVGVPVDRLLSQLQEAGVKVKDENAAVSEQDKRQLFEHLHIKGEEGDPKKITLKRKKVSEIKLGTSQGKTKTVSVEVRKKRTYVKRQQNSENTAENQEAENKKPEIMTPKTENKKVEETEKKESFQKPAYKNTSDNSGNKSFNNSNNNGNKKTDYHKKPYKPNKPANKTNYKVEVPETALDSGNTVEVRRKVTHTKKPEKSTGDSTRNTNTEQRNKFDVKKRPKRPENKQETTTTSQSTSSNTEHKKPKETKKFVDSSPPQQTHAKKPEIKKRPVRNDDEGAAAKKLKKDRKDEDRILTARDYNDLDVMEEKAARRSVKKHKIEAKKHAFEKPVAPQVREVSLYDGITVSELAQQMAVKGSEVIKELMKLGVMVTINQIIDVDTATLVVEEMGHKVKIGGPEDVEAQLIEEEEQREKEYISRPPVVTIMGHVDHGKTSLLDHIRKSRVTAGEAGGITQHIGAYHVETPRGVISFLDTPGHAAFTAMRARGAKLTDIVILVVAADDSVMPQTIEAIQHARAAEVPIIVAVNKIDKPEANPQRVRQDLISHEVVPEEFGGDIMFVEVSAKTGQGIDDLLEAILLQSEVMELQAIGNIPATGVILEASLDKGRGPVATVLIQNGLLKKGDILVSGQEFGRVRAMFNEANQPVEEAGPSIPVVILGLSGVPNAGDEAKVMADEKKAREVATFREKKTREAKLATQQASALDKVFEQIKEGEVATLHVIIKADVQGSGEALRDAFTKLSTQEAQVKIVAMSMGGINESDINLALTTQAIVIGFNVRADASARRIAQEQGIDMRYYSIIYDAIDDVKQVLSGMLAPELHENIIGTAEVKDVFRSSKFGTVAGCLVVEGTVRKGNPIRVLRNNIVIHEGDLSSLRRFKDDVDDVKSGTECGIGVKNFSDVREGDSIEVFERIEVKRTLD